jgi:hypothetical protein
MTQADYFLSRHPDKDGRYHHPPGIYFGLGESAYFSDVALGSSDHKKLAESPARFWWESRSNPMWEPDEITPALRIGRARHCIVLDGREAFEARYARKTLNWSTKAGMVEKAAFEAQGLAPLDDEAYARTLATKAIIEANPYLAETFTGMVGTEVSVFWNARGVPKKARFDGLKPRAIVDLKNIANERAIAFPKACLRYIDNYKAHVQAAHYLEARLAMRQLWEDGLVHGEHDDEVLAEVVDSDEFAFVFVFLQSSGAPLSHAFQLSYRRLPGGEEWNPIFDAGRRVLDRAEANYLRCMAAFGADTAWIEPAPIAELDSSQVSLPSWFLREADWEGV